MRIAVLDNDRSQADLVCQVLAARHACHSAQTGTAMLEHLQRGECDLLIMDWQAADSSNIGILREVRTRLPSTFPVLFLANRSGEDEIIAALEAGANDYLIKPIRRSELITRVQALLKRAYPEQNAAERLTFGTYTFETNSARVTLAGGVIDVTQKEFELALLLFRHLGRPLSRAFIQEAIWSHEADVPSRTIDTHVSRVRNKLGLRPENGFRLAPVYSYGYRLEQLR